MSFWTKELNELNNKYVNVKKLTNKLKLHYNLQYVRKWLNFKFIFIVNVCGVNVQAVILYLHCLIAYSAYELGV